MEIKLLTEKNIWLTEQTEHPSKDETGKLTQIIRQKDLEIDDRPSRTSVASYNQNVANLLRQLEDMLWKENKY